MKKIFSKQFVQLFLIIAVSLFIRFLFIDRVPIGISHDEADFIVNSKSVFLRFSDLTGTWFPLSFTTIPNVQAKSELLYLLLAPFVGPFPFSFLLAKTPFIVVNVLLIVVLYLIIRKLVGQKEALFVGLVAVFNPWFFYFSRTSFEAPVAMFFFFLSFYLLLVLRKWKILLVFIPLLLAFTSYMGTKLIFIPFCLITFLFVWVIVYKKRYTKQLITLFILCLILFSYFVFSVKSQPTGVRLTELNSPQSTEVSQMVDSERKLSVISSFQNLFSNKPTVFLDQSLKSYFAAFSTQLLFIDNSGYGVISLYQHGYFYYIEFLFLLAGGCFLFVKKRPVFYLFGSLLLIAPIPAVVSNLGLSFPLRGSFLFPIYVVFSGIGFATVWSGLAKATGGRALRILIIAIYSMSILNFMYLYFFRIPISNSEGFFFSSREVARYLSYAKQENKIIVVQGEPRELFKEYIFYSNILNKNTVGAMEKIFRTNNFTYGNVSFVSCSGVKDVSRDTLYIVAGDSACDKVNERIKETFRGRIAIGQLKDSGSIFNIYNDKVCSRYQLPSYIARLRLSDFRLESMSESSFCSTYMVRYSE